MSSPNQPANTPAPAANFIKNIVEADLAAGKHAQRRWAGHPGTAACGLVPSQLYKNPLDS